MPTDLFVSLPGCCARLIIFGLQNTVAAVFRADGQEDVLQLFFPFQRLIIRKKVKLYHTCLQFTSRDAESADVQAVIYFCIERSQKRVHDLFCA